MATYDEPVVEDVKTEDVDSDGLLLYDDTLLEEAVFSPSFDHQAIFNPLALEQALFSDETETTAEWLVDAINANDSTDSLVTGLLEFYRLDETVGSVISGVKGHAYSCDLSYYTRTGDAVYQKALRCTSANNTSSSGGRIIFPGMNLSANDLSFSLAAWVKKDNWATPWTGAWQYVLMNSRASSGSATTSHPGIHLFFSGSSAVHLYVYVIANNTIYSVAAQNVHQWVNNTWHHVVVTCDLETNTLNIYINGDLIDTGYVASTLDYTYTTSPYTSFAIGTRRFGRQYNQIAGMNYNGIGAWNIALDQAKIDRLYAYHPDRYTVSDTVIVHASWGVPADAIDQVLLYAGFFMDGDVIEELLAHDALEFFRSTFVSSAESVKVLDQYYITIPLSLIDALEIEGLITPTDGVILREAVVAADNFSATFVADNKILQNVSVQARSIAALSLVISEDLTIDGVLSGDTAILLRVAERLITTGVVATRLEAVAEIIQALLLSEAIHSGKDAKALEAFYLQPDVLDRLRAVARTVEAVVLTALPTNTAVISLTGVDTVTADTDLSTSALLHHFVSEGISFQFSFNTPEGQYTGWVMNTSSYAVTEYDNYPFNSFAKINGKYYGANDSGLYLLDGEDDAGIPIQARVKLGATNFGVSMLKRLDSVYLGFRTDGEVVLKVVTEQNIERWYKVSGTTEKLHRRRVHPLAKGHKAVWWEFELENIAGADFEVSEIEFVPIKLSRSV